MRAWVNEFNQFGQMEKLESHWSLMCTVVTRYLVCFSSAPWRPCLAPGSLFFSLFSNLWPKTPSGGYNRSDFKLRLSSLKIVHEGAYDYVMCFWNWVEPLELFNNIVVCIWVNKFKPCSQVQDWWYPSTSLAAFQAGTAHPGCTVRHHPLTSRSATERLEFDGRHPVGHA